MWSLIVEAEAGAGLLLKKGRASFSFLSEGIKPVAITVTTTSP